MTLVFSPFRVFSLFHIYYSFLIFISFDPTLYEGLQNLFRTVTFFTFTLCFLFSFSLTFTLCFFFDPPLYEVNAT
ncbi:hypothetical protein ACJX0J_023691, partial [Zea mays]